MPDPSVRVITLAWVNSQMAGDELLELWKKVAGTWSLIEAVPVDSTSEQTYEFSGVPGVAYVFQIRARRDGAYRTEYQSANPDDWPSASRLAYTAGMPTGVLTFVDWERTSAIRQILNFSWTNTDPARAVKFYRDDGGGFDLIATIAAGTSTYEYEIQTGEEATRLDFKIAQEDDDAVETFSNQQANIWAGPAEPTNLELKPPSGYTNIWYGYEVQWITGQTGASTKVQDDYCGAFQTRTTSGAGVESRLELGLQKNSALDPNGNVEVTVNVRIRHEITAFAVTDVSDWVELAVPVDIASDETAYGSC